MLFSFVIGGESMLDVAYAWSLEVTVTKKFLDYIVTPS